MGLRERADTLSLRIELGAGIRVQRALEAIVLVTAILTTDVRLVWVAFGMLAAQVISPRLAPGALLFALLRPTPKQHRISDIYNDFQGIRGACAVGVAMLTVGLVLIYSGQAVGWVFVACPTASCLLSPTVGFCAGCTCYVFARDLVKRATNTDPRVDGASDVILESDPARHP